MLKGLVQLWKKKDKKRDEGILEVSRKSSEGYFQEISGIQQKRAGICFVLCVPHLFRVTPNPDRNTPSKFFVHAFDLTPAGNSGKPRGWNGSSLSNFRTKKQQHANRQNF